MDHQAFAQLLGNYGEFVGAIAVVVTLFYLAVQVRQNSTIVRATARTQTNQTLSEFTRFVASDADLLRIFHTSATEFEALSPDERRQHVYLLRYMFMSSEFLFEQHTDGLVTEAAWQRELRALCNALTRPHIAAWWELRKMAFDPRFVVAVDRAVWTASSTPDEVVSFMIEAVRRSGDSSPVDAGP